MTMTMMKNLVSLSMLLLSSLSMLPTSAPAGTSTKFQNQPRVRREWRTVTLEQRQKVAA